jgi:hypothetical protein
LALVSHWIDNALGSPVNGASGVNFWENSVVLGSLFQWLVLEHFLVLIVSPGGEHVVGSSEGVVWITVDLSDGSISKLELIQSEFVLFSGSI